MAAPYDPDPNDFYALLDEIEIAARDARRIGNNDREIVIAELQEIRRKSNDAKDEDLIKWDSSLRDCLNNMESLDEQSKSIMESLDEQSKSISELLESAPENVEDLQNCLDQIWQEMGSS